MRFTSVRWPPANVSYARVISAWLHTALPFTSRSATHDYTGMRRMPRVELANNKPTLLPDRKGERPTKSNTLATMRLSVKGPDKQVQKRATTAVAVLNIIYRDVGSHSHFPPISLLQHARRRVHSKDDIPRGIFCCTSSLRQAVFQA
jgi:hypothetical protein